MKAASAPVRQVAIVLSLQLRVVKKDDRFLRGVMSWLDSLCLPVSAPFLGAPRRRAVIAGVTKFPSLSIVMRRWQVFRGWFSPLEGFGDQGLSSTGLEDKFRSNKIASS